MNPLNVLIWYFIDAFKSPNIIFRAIPDPAFLLKWFDFFSSFVKTLPDLDNLILLILFLKRFRHLLLKISVLCFINFATFFIIYTLLNLDITIVQDYISLILSTSFSVPFSSEQVSFTHLSDYIQTAVQSNPIFKKLPSLDTIKQTIDNITHSLSISVDLKNFLKYILYSISDACNQLADYL